MSIKKKLISIPLTSLDFYTYEKDGIQYIEYDARECSPPEPMVNTINALKMLQDDTSKLVGKFFHEPFPLYERIAPHFSYTAKELESGDFEIIFTRKKNNQ